MQSRDTLTAYKAENEKLMEILLEYVERYGLTDRARQYYMGRNSVAHPAERHVATLPVRRAAERLQVTAGYRARLP